MSLTYTDAKLSKISKPSQMRYQKKVMIKWGLSHKCKVDLTLAINKEKILCDHFNRNSNWQNPASIHDYKKNL